MAVYGDATNRKKIDRIAKDMPLAPNYTQTEKVVGKIGNKKLYGKIVHFYTPKSITADAWTSLFDLPTATSKLVNIHMLGTSTNEYGEVMYTHGLRYLIDGQNVKASTEVKAFYISVGAEFYIEYTKN